MTARGKQRLCLSAIAALVALGLIWLLTRPSSPDFFIYTGIGAIFGQTTLAAAWCVLGPFPLAWRLSLSALWVAAIILCFGWKMEVATSPDDLDLLLTFAVVVPSQWTLIAIPLSIAAGCFGLRINSTIDRSATRSQQFGIREALFLTGVVAMVLGWARFRVGDLGRASIIWDAVAVFGSAVLANSVLAMPLLAFALVPRRWPRMLVYSALSLAIVNAMELVLLYWLAAGPLEAFWATTLINMVQGAWIIAVISLLRVGHFTLMTNRLTESSNSHPKS